MVVSDESGGWWVVKQYHRPGWAPSADVLDLLDDLRSGRSARSWAADARLRHLVWVEEWGTDPATGRFYEVQEYLPDGDLTRYAPPGASRPGVAGWDPVVLVGALTDALDAFHATVRSAHRDIKPANTLIRTTGDGSPVLVLGDIGLAREVGEASHRQSRREGSAAYQAPEAAHGKVSRAGDWWSVGIIGSEVALGRHPLALEDGRLPDDQTLQIETAEHDIDLSAIEDVRLRQLCSGLLTRDTEHRWRRDQVRAWQRGESPPVHTPTTSPGPGRTGPRRTVLFSGVDYDTPEALATAMAADPQTAGRILFEQRDPIVIEDLKLMLGAHSLHDATAVLTSHQSGPWEPTLLRLLAEMHPGLTPTWAGISLAPAEMATLAADVVEAGHATTEQRDALQAVLVFDAWRIWRRLPGMAEAAQAASRLVPVADALPAAGLAQGRIDSPRRVALTTSGEATWADVASIPGHDEIVSSTTVRDYWMQTAPVLNAWLILLAVHPNTTTAQLIDTVTKARHDLTDVAWWTQLADNPNPAQQALAAATTGLAHTTNTARTAALQTHREQAEQQRQEQARQAVQTRRRLQITRDWERRRSELSTELRRLESRDHGSIRDLGVGVFAGIALGSLFLSMGIISILPLSSPGGEQFTLSVFLAAPLVVLSGIYLHRRHAKMEASIRSIRMELSSGPRCDDPKYVWIDADQDWVRRTSSWAD